MASRILGMGDVLTLIEKAQDTADQKKAEETAKRLMQNKFDMNDMLDQFEQVKKMGGAAAMMSMFPGAGRISDDELDEKRKRAWPHEGYHPEHDKGRTRQTLYH